MLDDDGNPVEPDEPVEVNQPLKELVPENWTFRVCPGGSGVTAVSAVVARSLQFPGAVAVAQVRTASLFNLLQRTHVSHTNRSITRTPLSSFRCSAGPAVRQRVFRPRRAVRPEAVHAAAAGAQDRAQGGRALGDRRRSGRHLKHFVDQVPSESKPDTSP